MKLFMATLGTETNTFSPFLTAKSGFADTLLKLDRDASSKPPSLFTGPSMFGDGGRRKSSGMCWKA